jgi:acetoin utilization deacetylase AcuC-like enzyme
LRVRIRAATLRAVIWWRKEEAVATGFLWDEWLMWHDTRHGGAHLPAGGWVEPGEPFSEYPATKRRLRNLLEVSGLLDDLVPLRGRPATEEEVLRLHTAEYIASIRELSDANGGDAGEGVPFGPGSFEIAMRAVGGGLETVDAVLDGTIDNAYALLRPPGHHAEAARGRGFCIFGNTALAAMHARAVRGVGRVAIVDWDVHHGNGTEDAFAEEPDVLTISIHGNDHYPPNRGHLADRGRGAGEGANINIPLPHGSGAGAYVAAFEQVVVPSLRAHRPELILIASGFDANMLDPQARMMMHSDGYRRLTELMLEAAAELCDGRLALLHEGGYSAAYVPFCGLATIETLAGRRTDVVDPYLEAIARMPDQAVQPHQVAVIEQAAALVASVPAPGREAAA